VATVSVGVVANPASGRDVRRLVTGASVFDNAEKGAMVHRLMAGLGAVGVDRVIMMPAGSGVSQSLQRHLGGRTGHLAAQRLPELEVLDMAVHEDERDSAAAVRAMAERRVAAIVVLGGDGTHRVVAAHCGDIPLCALSTGTNNAFPELREATVAGVAAGLVATARLEGDGLLRREKQLQVSVNGGLRRDSALVDVAVTTERWVGARSVACRHPVRGGDRLRQPQRGRPVGSGGGSLSSAKGRPPRTPPPPGPTGAGTDGRHRPPRARAGHRGRRRPGQTGRPRRGRAAHPLGRLPGPGRRA
jgi:hypothetical protein